MNILEEREMMKKTANNWHGCKLIKGDINSLYHYKGLYPSFTDISSMDMNIDFLPSSLRGLTNFAHNVWNHIKTEFPLNLTVLLVPRGVWFRGVSLY